MYRFLDFIFLILRQKKNSYGKFNITKESTEKPTENLAKNGKKYTNNSKFSLNLCSNSFAK